MTAETERALFEAYFVESRRGNGRKKLDHLFDRLDDGTYAYDSTQRHWWTWQQARASIAVPPESESEGGAPGATDAERAEWLADKIVALGDYAKEAAAMLRRWPASPVAAGGDAVATDLQEKELGACSISRATIGDRTHDRRPEESHRRVGEEEQRGREAGGRDAVRASGAESGARGGDAGQHEVIEGGGTDNAAHPTAQAGDATNAADGVPGTSNDQPKETK
jgi:hypothetical protein